ncbi:MAG: amidohydrolase [Syntrophaceae bacterium]|nr:amidohydrolase [Syntrophaceae bacterium]
MQRRDFLKKALFASGLAGIGWFPPSPVSGQTKKERALEKEYRIDAYCHFSIMRIIDFLEKASNVYPHVFRSLFANTPTLIDVEKRLTLMDRCGIDLSVLVPLPWLETTPAVHADPKLCAEAARLFNDEMAITVSKRPDRFLGVALVPTTHPEIMVAEFERAVRTLKLVGGFFVVGPTVKPPDHPHYEFLYQKAVELNVPLWIHPSRPPDYPDYVGEKISQYQVWQTLSWLLDSSTAMIRLVFNGVFERYPDLKLIIHHHGALVPLFAKRMQYGWDYFEQNTGKKQPTPISHPYIDHFKKFYCDTATQGDEPLLLKMTYDFFGPDHLLFGSDAPMDPTDGKAFTLDARQSVEGLGLGKADSKKIFSQNILRLLKRG